MNWIGKVGLVGWVVQGMYSIELIDSSFFILTIVSLAAELFVKYIRATNPLSIIWSFGIKLVTLPSVLYPLAGSWSNFFAWIVLIPLYAIWLFGFILVDD